MFNKAGYLSTVACIAITSAAAFAPTAAMAQDVAAIDATDSVNDIVVTAQRREQSLQDVPISVTVASGETMRESQITDLNDLSSRLSGVRINNAGASDSLNVRGVGSGFNMGFEQAVATFVDGVYLSRSQVSRGGFLDLERIEVLKGPQSTYFGSNAIAGALSITTRKPSQSTDGYASFLYSPSDGEYDLQAAVGGALTDKLSGRAAIRFSGMEGYIKNTRFNNKGPDNNDKQGRIALRYETPGVLDINLRVDYAKYDDQRNELQEVVNCPPAPGYGTGPNLTNPAGTCAGILASGDQDNILNYITATGNSSFELESVSSALNAAWTFGNHTLTSTTGFYHHDLFRTTVSGASLAVASFNLPNGLPLSQPERFRSFSQELRLQSDTGGLIDYTFGLYYDNSNLKGGINVGFYFSDFATLARPAGSIPAGTPIAQEVFGDQDQSNRSVFAAATINLAESLRLNLGARYSSIKKEAHRTTRAGRGNAIGQVIQDFTPSQFVAWTTSVGRPAGDYAITKRTDDKFMPSIALQYDVTPDIMTYASYSTGFKSGGWSIGQGLDIFAPENVKSYEAGVKAAWFDRRLTTNLTVFNGDYSNLQESTTIIDPVTGINQAVIANVGKARSRGVEFEVGLRPFSGFSLSGNVGYLDAKYLSYPNAPCTLLQLASTPRGTTCTQNLAGKRKAYAPVWSGSVNASYAFDVTPDLVAKLGSWVYFTSGYYQQASFDPILFQPGYTKIDLRASLGSTNDSWELAVIAKNVTDEVTGSYRAAQTGSNAVAVRVDRARSFAIQVSSKF